MSIAIRLLLVCALMGCAARFEPPGNAGDDDGADAGAGPDGMVATPPDAAPPAPDAMPLPKPYPPGPYGTTTGSTIANLAWQGYADTDADADADPFNEAAHAVTLEDFFSERDPGAKVLVITSSAGWCSACQEEASYLPEVAAEWVPRGARFLTALIEDENGYPCDTEFALAWGDYFELTTPVVADPDLEIDPYYVDGSIPFNLFIETEGMTIVDKMTGYDHDEMEAILDAYTD